MEPIINITVSIILVINYGLIGVAIGTLVATIFRTIQYSTYVCKNIIKRNQFITLEKIIVSVLEGGIILWIVNIINMNTPTTFLEWGINAAITVVISCAVVFLGCMIFYHSTLKDTIKKVSNLIK